VLASDTKLTSRIALKMKHSKTDDDTKYMGTLLGKMIEHGDVVVEGGEYPSISMWEEHLKKMAEKSPEVAERAREESEAPSSGLSSLGDRTIADEMELEMDMS
jgi:transcription initiation factor TFIID subunit 3